MLLDNCSAHPSEDELISADCKVTAKFLPLNITALLQLMVQGVHESITWVNKKSNLRDLVSQSTFTIHDIVKRIDTTKIVDTVESAWDMIPTAIKNSWKKFMPLPSSSIQISEPLEEITSNEVIQQFSTINIIFTDDDIKNWMSCDGPGYEPMDEQGIVSLISGDHEKQIDEEVEDDNNAPQTAKCPFSHSEAMQKMDDFLAYYQYQPGATQ